MHGEFHESLDKEYLTPVGHISEHGFWSRYLNSSCATCQLYNLANLLTLMLNENNNTIYLLVFWGELNIEIYLKCSEWYLSYSKGYKTVSGFNTIIINWSQVFQSF